MNFKEAVKIANNQTINFGERVDAKIFINSVEHTKKVLGKINGEELIVYEYKMEEQFYERFYYYKNGIKTVAQLVALINRLLKYSEKCEISTDVLNEFENYINWDNIEFV